MICLHTWSRETTSKYDMTSIVRVPLRPLRASGSSKILQSSNSQDVKHSSEIFASPVPISDIFTCNCYILLGLIALSFPEFLSQLIP